MLSALAQPIALTDVMLSVAAASARHQYMLLALALVLNCTGWRSTLTRCLAKGQLIAPAGVTLAVTAASACLCRAVMQVVHGGRDRLRLDCL